MQKLGNKRLCNKADSRQGQCSKFVRVSVDVQHYCFPCFILHARHISMLLLSSLQFTFINNFRGNLNTRTFWNKCMLLRIIKLGNILVHWLILDYNELVKLEPHCISFDESLSPHKPCAEISKIDGKENCSKAPCLDTSSSSSSSLYCGLASQDHILESRHAILETTVLYFVHSFINSAYKCSFRDAGSPTSSSLPECTTCIWCKF